MGILSPSAVQRRLKRFESRLAEAVRRAWDRYLSKVAPVFKHAPPTRLRANAVQALIIEEVTEMFPERVFRARGRSLLWIAEDLIVQFKKLDRRGRPRNYPTQTALRFNAQLDIPGIPAATRATIGYQLDKVGTKLVALSVVLQDRHGIDRWDLGEAETPVLPLVAAPASTPRRPARVKPGIVKPKKAKDGDDPQG